MGGYFKSYIPLVGCMPAVKEAISVRLSLPSNSAFGNNSITTFNRLFALATWLPSPEYAPTIIQGGSL